MHMGRGEVKGSREVVRKVFKGLICQGEEFNYVLNSYAKPVEGFKQENGTI